MTKVFLIRKFHTNVLEESIKIGQDQKKLIS